MVKATKRRTKIDRAQFMKDLVDDHYKDAEKIVIIMDNLNPHTKSSLYEAFKPAKAKRITDKLEIHCAPKQGSWLNIAEIELSHLSRQCLDRRIANRGKLASEIAAWGEVRNKMRIITNWRFTAETALAICFIALSVKFLPHSART